MELQQADREILRLNQEVAALPKRVAAIEEKLAGTKAGLEKAKTAVKADEATRRKYESAIQDLQGKISKYRDQSLAVKTNEQYKALLHEIQFAEQEIKSNEDKILELMLNADARDSPSNGNRLELGYDGGHEFKRECFSNQVFVGRQAFDFCKLLMFIYPDHMIEVAQIKSVHLLLHTLPE